MAQPSCPKCQSHMFELKEYEPANAEYKQDLHPSAACAEQLSESAVITKGQLPDLRRPFSQHGRASS
jgi:hypothetical protein